MNHYYDKIQGWFNFQQVYSMAAEVYKDGSLFVEIGSWKGTSSVYMGVELINKNKLNTRFVCIDTWGENDDGEYLNESSIKNNTLYSEFLDNIKPLLDNKLNLEIIRDRSDNVSDRFVNNSIDFLYIDGSHLYENVKNDIKLYLPKIKNGGIIAGHDWQCDDVRKAVMEFFDMSHINLIHNTWLIKIENNL
jgi:hypothetical protein